MRDNDLAARTGGEEFSAMLLDTPLDHAHEVAERIRLTIENTPIVLENGQALSQTVSIGIAAYHPSENDLGPTVQRADAALYKAKQEGRNRVRIFEPLPPGSEKSA
jgi:diguanylate cyclase (GGDEF)-like protein